MIYKKKNEKLLVYILSLCILPCAFTSAFLLVEVKNIASSFNISTQDFYLRTLIYFTCLPVTIRYFSYFLKNRNVKPFLCWAVIIFSVGNILSVYTKSWHVFLFFQCINSIADGLILICISLFFKMYILENNLGRSYGVHTAIISLTSALALSIGSTIAYYMGWKIVFLLISIFSLLALGLYYKLIPSNQNTTISLDKKNFLSSSLKFLVFVLLIFFINFTVLKKDVSFTFKSISLFFYFSSLVALITFDKIFDVGFSIIPKAVFNSHEYWRTMLVVLLVFLPINIYSAFLPTYLMINHEISFVVLGYFLTMNEILIFLFSPFFGKKSDHNIYAILISGITLSVLCFSIFFVCINLNESWVNTSLFFTILTYGVALSMINPAISKLIIVSTPKQDVSEMTGFYLMIKFFTNSIATILFNFYTNLKFIHVFLMEYYLLFFTAILCSIFLIVLILVTQKHKLKFSQ